VHAASAQEFWDNAEQNNEPVYGNSDSANIFVLSALLAARPLTKVVWIDRPIKDCVISMSKAGFPHSNESVELLVNLRLKCESLFDLKIDFSDLGCLQVITQLWRFLLGQEVPFDYGRWGVLEATRMAYNFNEYLERPRDLEKFLAFISQEGEMKCQS
jgi:hypothetical protein